MTSDRVRVISEALRGGAPIAGRAVVVVAHPDDETLGMGGRLACLENLTLVQVTDGAPRRGPDAARAGCKTREGYAALREREARSAIESLGITACCRLAYQIPDQEAVLALAGLVRLLTRDLRDAEIVFTHPYEGGHPDHDAAALAVQRACEALGAAGRRPPVRFEFASYHSKDGERVAGRFWAEPSCPEVEVRLSAGALARKRRALACYRTQADVIAWFDPAFERYRRAPRYDFSRPPAPGIALYDTFGWAMTSPLWRTIACQTLSPPESVPCGISPS